MTNANALEYLKWAKSYLHELGEKFDLLESGDKNIIGEFARLLDLALEQIHLIEKNDPTVSWGDYDLNEAKLDYNYFKGGLEFFKGNYNGAISYLRQALNIDPDFEFVYVVLADCYWNIGNKEEAIKNIKCAAELKPENIDYKNRLNWMISASKTISSSPFEEENEKKNSAKKSIYISIGWALIGGICGFASPSVSGHTEVPTFLLAFGFAYIFWSTYWGWRVLHGLFKKVISGITPTGCFIIMPIMYWITVGIFYISILIWAAAIFGSFGGGIATFLVYLKRAGADSKNLTISFASLLIFVSILGLLTSKAMKGKISLEKADYYKEEQSSISETKKHESKPPSLNREPVESITTEQKIIPTPSISLLSLDEAKQRIPLILKKIYQDLDQGNPRASISFISSNIFSNSKLLDTICKPFTYRAHYIENIIERPNNKFEVMTRLLSQPVEEIAQVLIFRVEDNSFVLESVSKYPDEWFDNWKEEAKEIARNFYYAIKADREDVLNKLLSSLDVLSPEFTSSFRFYPVKSYSKFQKKVQSLGAISSINSKIISYKGLKALVHFSFESSGMARTWDIYVDNIDGKYKIVKWQYEEWTWGAHGSDPNIESYTLKRFKSKEELNSFLGQTMVPKTETEKMIEEKREVLNEKIKQELEERDNVLGDVERKKKPKEEKIIKTEKDRKEKKPVRAIGKIKPPKPIRKVEPVYPNIAKEARVEGVVILEVTIDIYGKVKNIKVLRSIPLLDQAAVDAVRQRVYEPVVIDGKPREVIFTATVFFKLPN